MVNNLYDRWLAVLSHIASGSTDRIRSIPIPWDRVIESGEQVPRFEPGKHYFSVVINELFLANSRQWWNLYDPMALVLSEFTYGGQRSVVPYVVGPSMLKDKVQQVPNGMTITDTQVAGIHPYVGGKFALTVILAQVKRDSYSKRLLSVVENISAAFPIGPALQPHLKVAGAIMDGVESLFGMEDTKPIMGHRFEFNDGVTPWLTPGFFALIDADEQTIDRAKLSVLRGRLRNGRTENAPAYSDHDYLLYSLSCLEQRNDVSELPFHQIFFTALQNAGSLEEGAWDRAKANLVTLFQALLVSPDLTWAQAQRLIEGYRSKLLETRDKVRSFSELAAASEVSDDGRLTEVFGRFPSAERDQRAGALMNVHDILNLN